MLLGLTELQAHKDPKPLKLYSGWFCPFVQRAWSVLEEKGIPYEYIEVNPYHKPESLLKLNPRGLVPTLQFHEKPLYESNVICELLEEAYPGYGRSLLPKDLYDRARMRIWQDYITSRIIPSYHRFLQHQPSSDRGSDGGLDNARKEFQDHILEFTKEMHPEGPFFMGSEPQMIDFLMAPWAIRMWVFEHFKHIPGVPPEGSGGQDEATWARWRKFENAIGSLKSIQNTTSEREKYFSIYQKYADDKASDVALTSASPADPSLQAQSEMAKSIRAGRGVV